MLSNLLTIRQQAEAVLRQFPTLSREELARFARTEVFSVAAVVAVAYAITGTGVWFLLSPDATWGLFVGYVMYLYLEVSNYRHFVKALRSEKVTRG